ncbi:MAG: twin-arginine translocase TatA/TatE family subunit [Actinomycetota bacterium]|jgi:sec-independent protein translocase protein TatA
MFRNGLEGWHLIVLVLLVLLLWGGPKLPGLAKSLGESMRIFRKEMKTLGDERNADKKEKDKEDKPSDK